MANFNSSRPTFAKHRGVVQYVIDGKPMKLRVDEGDRIQYAIGFQRLDGSIGRAFLDQTVRGPIVQPFAAGAL